MSKPPFTNPPRDLELGADYDTPLTYGRIGRALMVFLFITACDEANRERIAWLCDGVTRTNGAPLFDKNGFTRNPTAHPSHWMQPRGSWGQGTTASSADVEWRCGWCGAEDDSDKAEAPCGWGRGMREGRS
jgi:hypothetical protein